MIRRRMIMVVVMFLPLGAVVNVGVAWGLALWAETSGIHLNDSQARRGLNRHDQVWLIAADSQQGRWRSSVLYVGDVVVDGQVSYRALEFFVRTGVLDSSSTTIELPNWSRLRGRANSRSRGYEDARGWPFISLRTNWFEGLDEGGSGFTWTREPPSWGIEVGASSRSGQGLFPTGPGPRILPLHPVWPGFAINTLLYAGVCWLLISGSHLLRRCLRTRRGLCAKCGYRRGASAVCTECGAQLRPIKPRPV